MTLKTKGESCSLPVNVSLQRTCVTFKTLSNLNWMLCYKHVLVIDRKYCNMVKKMHCKRNQNLEDTLWSKPLWVLFCPGPVHVSREIKYKHMLLKEKQKCMFHRHHGHSIWIIFFCLSSPYDSHTECEKGQTETGP